MWLRTWSESKSSKTLLSAPQRINLHEVQIIPSVKLHYSQCNVALPTPLPPPPLVRKFVTPKVSNYSNKLRLGLGRCYLERRAYCWTLIGKFGSVRWTISWYRGLGPRARPSYRQNGVTPTRCFHCRRVAYHVRQCPVLSLVVSNNLYFLSLSHQLA